MALKKYGLQPVLRAREQSKRAAARCEAAHEVRVIEKQDLAIARAEASNALKRPSSQTQARRP